jgi:hypothetical protein
MSMMGRPEMVLAVVEMTADPVAAVAAPVDEVDSCDTSRGNIIRVEAMCETKPEKRPAENQRGWVSEDMKRG